MSHTNFVSIIAAETQCSPKQVAAALRLLDEGATIPFIARYRKEATDGLDEVQLIQIRDLNKKLQELERRRNYILKSIEEQGKLTEELKNSIANASTLAELEDIYLPFKPKRKTRASVAKEKGLEPLAQKIWAQTAGDCEQWAKAYISIEKGVETIEAALQGSRDIMAEWVSEYAEARKKIRQLFMDKALLTSKVVKGKEQAALKYKDYFDWTEPLAQVPSHRMLAMKRGESEGYLLLDIAPDEADAIALLKNIFIKLNNPAAKQVEITILDAYRRLLQPSIEAEVRAYFKEKADEEAIKTFAVNVAELLMAPPLGARRVLAIDPGFRTGCKTVALDEQGNLLATTVLFPEIDSKKQPSAELLNNWVEKYRIEVIAIGNGTASRETETFVRNHLQHQDIPVVLVNESGASIYSASEVAREEFPDQDITVRGAVSIGRRLQDPLAELVKIDPKSIGVGQYQHDVDQTKLKEALDDVVISCVNKVGVEVNTASKQLLMYVSGLGPVLAQNIVEYRKQYGPFKSREELKKVARMGEKAFEQSAGFLRIRDAVHPLDASAVHPERYPLVQRMAQDLGCTVHALMQDEALRKKIPLSRYIDERTALTTLHDIVAELAKPGRDPREKFEPVQFADSVKHPEDLKIGMKLPGIVTNVTKFGAFVDIGVHQDGLVHISHLSDSFIKDPSEKVKVHQRVEVTVIEVDLNRKRIGLSMKSDPFGQYKPTRPKQKEQPKELADSETFHDKLSQLKAFYKQR